MKIILLICLRKASFYYLIDNRAKKYFTISVGVGIILDYNDDVVQLQTTKTTKLFDCFGYSRNFFMSYEYSAGHLVPTTFIGLADLSNLPKMEMHDQKTRCHFEAKTFLYKVTFSFC